MTKILVLSDSHGNVNNMVIAVKETKPDMIFHLGDCWSDAVTLHKQYPDITMVQVPGNCDCVMEPSERLLEMEGVKLLLCHGHAYNVKSSLLSLEYAAREKQVDIALYGHTHAVGMDWNNGVRLYNPGSIGAPRFNNPAAYGVLTLDQESNLIDFQAKII
ncbi:MAG: metallophosphoesterase [Lachnospiraceae bacterium]|nr:metallophosphoesterase [Lachnospiraceae bacterium]MDD6504745.1 metallophosphoesterase [Lachnospiraceae bacterium]